MTTVRALRLLPWSVCCGCAASLVLIVLQYGLQRTSPSLLLPRANLIAGIGAVGVVAAVAGVALRALPLEGSHLFNGRRAAGAAAFLWSLNVAALLSVIPITLLVWRFDVDVVGGWTYPFLNKRWLVAGYYIVLGAVLVLPVYFAPRAAAAATEGLAFQTSWPGRVAAVASLAAIAWLFTGPPWNMARHHRPIDFHEQVHLGPLQAIDRGYSPFVGPASTHYGPGTQLFSYWSMKFQERFDVVGFRVAQATLQFLATIVVALLAYAWCGWWRAVVILLLALAYSPLRFLFPLADGTMGGDYEWGNAWRYLGPVVAIPWMAHIVTRRTSARLVVSGVAIGLAWGVFSWIAQENLLSTLVAASIVLALFTLTGAASWRDVQRVSICMLAGCAAVWTMVVVIYAARGEATAYIENYFVVASAVAMGFQNTWWTDSHAMRAAYYLTPVAAVAVIVCTIWDPRTLQLRSRYTARQVTLVAFAAVLLASYQTALYRSDAAHLMNVAMALPFVLVLGLSDLPFWQDGTPGRWVARAAVAALVLVVWPFGDTLLAHPVQTLRTASARFQPAQAAPQPVIDSVPTQRATPALSDEPLVATGAPPMREFLELASRLRHDIGARPVYVADTFLVYSSLYYFIADLTPGPFLGDPETMIINSRRRERSLEHFRQNLGSFRALVTTRIDGPEAVVFRGAYLDARVTRYTEMGHEVFVFAADGEPR